jgi:hypothetical protein
VSFPQSATNTADTFGQLLMVQRVINALGHPTKTAACVILDPDRFPAALPPPVGDKLLLLLLLPPQSLMVQSSMVKLLQPA